MSPQPGPTRPAHPRVRSTDRLCVFGETGSGKSTLLKALLCTAPRDRSYLVYDQTVEYGDVCDWRADGLAGLLRSRNYLRRHGRVQIVPLGDSRGGGRGPGRLGAKAPRRDARARRSRRVLHADGTFFISRDHANIAARAAPRIDGLGRGEAPSRGRPAPHGPRLVVRRPADGTAGLAVLPRAVRGGAEMGIARVSRVYLRQRAKRALRRESGFREACGHPKVRRKGLTGRKSAENGRR